MSSISTTPKPPLSSALVTILPGGEAPFCSSRKPPVSSSAFVAAQVTESAPSSFVIPTNAGSSESNAAMDTS